MCEGLPRDCPKGAGLAGPDVEFRPDHDLTRLAHAARVVPEPHRVPGHGDAFARRSHEPDLVHEIADVAAAVMGVAADRPADRAGRAGPGFERRKAPSDGPAHQAIERHAGARPNPARAYVGRGLADLVDARHLDANDNAPNARVRDEEVRPAAD